MILFCPYTEKYNSEEARLLAFFTHSLHEGVLIFSRVEDWRPVKLFQIYFFDNSTTWALQPYFILEWFLLKNTFLTSCEFLTMKCLPRLLIQLLKWSSKNKWIIKQSRFFFIVVLDYCKVLETVSFHDGYINKKQRGIANWLWPRNTATNFKWQNVANNNI